ncbi:MAG: energy transducer TonB [Sphingomicrobium sp.]
MGSNRTGAIIVVALIHILLGYALVSGLAMSVGKKVVEDLKTFDVEEEPPPPEEEPPPPEQQSETPPPPQVAAPPPLVRTPVQESPVQATPNPPPFVPTPVARPAPPAPPAPPPPVKRSEPKSAVGSLQGLFRDTDYPEAALEREEQGSVSATLQIGTTGRVTGCSITSSSGSRTLDSATCRILTSRARFTPAQDSSGNPTTGSAPARITWRLQ